MGPSELSRINTFKANIHNSSSDNGAQELGFMGTTKPHSLAISLFGATGTGEHMGSEGVEEHGVWGSKCGSSVQREVWRRRREPRASNTRGIRSRGGRETG